MRPEVQGGALLWQPFDVMQWGQPRSPLGAGNLATAFSSWADCLRVGACEAANPRHGLDV